MDKKTKKTTEERQDVFLYVLKKTERISAVNSIFAKTIDDDPVFKDTLMRKSMSLYEAALMLYSGRSGVVEDTIDRVKDHLIALESLYEIARHGRILSNENCLLMMGECNELTEFIMTHGIPEAGAHTKESTEVGRAMVEIPPFVHSRERDIISIEPQEKSAIAEPKPLFKRTENTNDLYNVFYDKSNKTDLQNTTPVTAPAQKDTVKTTQSKHKDRRAQILGLLQTKDKITIKDVAEQITDCSEKTIQRELVALVSQGVLKKEGERRWSTYSLA